MQNLAYYEKHDLVKSRSWKKMDGQYGHDGQPLLSIPYPNPIELSIVHTLLSIPYSFLSIPCPSLTGPGQGMGMPNFLGLPAHLYFEVNIDPKKRGREQIANDPLN